MCKGKTFVKRRYYSSHASRVKTRKERSKYGEPVVEELPPGDPTYVRVLRQFTESWDETRCPVPPIKKMYEILPKVPIFDRYRQKAKQIEGKKPGHFRNYNETGNENK